MRRLAGFAFAVVALTPTGAFAASPPTFTRDVAPILYNSCVSCHRPGEVAPMSLVSYEDVRPWAKSIREKVANRDMPPWHADPKFRETRRQMEGLETRAAEEWWHEVVTDLRAAA